MQGTQAPDLESWADDDATDGHGELGDRSTLREEYTSVQAGWGGGGPDHEQVQGELQVEGGPPRSGWKLTPGCTGWCGQTDGHPEGGTTGE